MLRLALLIVGTWTLLSFLFTWAWGAGISRLSASYKSPSEPRATQDAAASLSLEEPQHTEQLDRKNNDAA
jgi:hypothetical protein